MTSAAKRIAQLAAYLMFATLIALFSASPAYEYADAGMATIKLSLSHAANRVSPCVRLTPQQVAELAPNMRHAEQCERERVPLVVELEVDTVLVARIVAPPSGVWRDGAAAVYQRFEVDPGEHHVSVRLRDSSREDGWDYSHARLVELEPGRYFTITFQAANGGFRFR